MSPALDTTGKGMKSAVSPATSPGKSKDGIRAEAFSNTPDDQVAHRRSRTHRGSSFTGGRRPFAVASARASRPSIRVAAAAAS